MIDININKIKFCQENFCKIQYFEINFYNNHIIPVKFNLILQKIRGLLLKLL